MKFDIAPHALTRRALLGALGAGAAGAAFGQPNWTPSSAVKLVVPYAAGGGTDVLARMISNTIGSGLGQPIIVDNRPGANGIVATNFAYAAPPDGQTLLFAAADFISVAPHVYATVVRFDPTGFTPVALIAKMGFVLASRPDSPTKDLAEVIARARRKEVSYAHWGPGSTSQMAMELLRSKAPGTKMLAVPYTGAAPVLNAVMAGEVDYGFIPTPLAIASRDKLRLYAIASPARFPALSDVPTLKEKGYDVDADTWFGVLAPPKTPANVIAALRAQIAIAARDPKVLARMAELGYTPTTVPASQFGAFIKAEYDRWGAVVRAANIRVGA